jgi:hypothetical protein
MLQGIAATGVETPALSVHNVLMLLDSQRTRSHAVYEIHHEEGSDGDDRYDEKKVKYS